MSFDISLIINPCLWNYLGERCQLSSDQHISLVFSKKKIVYISYASPPWLLEHEWVNRTLW